MKVIKVSQLLVENEALKFVHYFKTEESTSDTLATGIVQIFKSTNLSWILLNTGVLYLIHDQRNGNFYLKLYSPIEATATNLLWQQDIPSPCFYESSTAFFQMLEGHDCIFGINFCDIFEAHEFYLQINQYILSANLENQGNFFNCIKVMKFSWLGRISLREFRKRRKHRERKLKISSPSNYQHVAHFGTDGNYNGAENNEIVEEIKKVLKADKNFPSDNIDNEEFHDYVNWIATEVHKMDYNENKMVAKRSIPRPPEISWSYDEDIKNMIKPMPTVITNNFSSSESQSASQNENNSYQSRQQLVNAIAAAIAKRNVAHNYSASDDNDLTSDDEWD